jgi:hypothetical protein
MRSWRGVAAQFKPDRLALTRTGIQVDTAPCVYECGDDVQAAAVFGFHGRWRQIEGSRVLGVRVNDLYAQKAEIYDDSDGHRAVSVQHCIGHEFADRDFGIVGPMAGPRTARLPDQPTSLSGWVFGVEHLRKESLIAHGTCREWLRGADGLVGLVMRTHLALRLPFNQCQGFGRPL